MAPRGRSEVRLECELSPAGIGETATLNNGVEMPLLGLGVYRAGPGGGTVDAVTWALEAGYRLIDTAALYGNEEEVGLAIRQSGVARERIFVTTKLWNPDHGYDKTIRAFHGSLEALGLEYVDLYLIHWPVEGLRVESWKALVRLADEEICRAVGVSNYTVGHLAELLGSSDLAPAVNQVEFSPFLYQRELLSYCRARGIQLEAYSPLARTARFADPTLVRIAGRHRKTPPQVMIRWVLQHGVVAIPKSSNRDRIHENADVFDFSLSAADMRLLDSLDEGLRVSWDPTGVP